MYTRCPDCHTDFRLSAAELAEAQGLVRCSRCGATFNALDYLYDELPPPEPELPARLTVPVAGGDAALEDEASSDWWTIPPDLGVVEDPPQSALAGGDAEPAGEEPETEVDSPFGAPPSAPRGGRRRLFWGSLSVVAVAVLLAQGVFWNWNTWAENPDLRPMMNSVCKRVPGGCRLPPFVMLDRLQLRNYQFTADPGIPGALAFSGVLVNHAPLAQAFPLLHISMDNRWGDTVAVGTFGPADYLGEPLDPEQGIPPGQPVPIRLDLRDPGAGATGFQFEFYSPER